MMTPGRGESNTPCVSELRSRTRMLRRVVCIVAAGGLVALGTPRAEAQVRYTVAVANPAEPLYRVTAEFQAPGDTLLVSLPAWTPGHYKIEDYARYVRTFEARDGAGRVLDWDKVDKDTWRIVSAGAGTVRVTLKAWADTVSLSHSLLRNDFGFFNGTNLFLFREGGAPGGATGQLRAEYDVPAEVRFELPDGWRVVTPLPEGESRAGVYHAADYHELVDSPTFVGHFAVDSVTVDGAWIVTAVYPVSAFQGRARHNFLNAVQKIAGAANRIFGGPPYDRYTLLLYLETKPIMFGGGLEHANAQLDILPLPAFADGDGELGPFVLPLIAHEYLHRWNVKRIRPAELWPYDYRVEQFTPLLWVSEGITDYYAKLALARSGLWDADRFWDAVRADLEEVESEDTIEAVEDASLNTWIEPMFISDSYYYPKGSLLGLLLDIRIRDATGNRASLDDAMRRLYDEFYGRGRGFNTADLLAILSSYLGAEKARAFYDAYIDGREPLPYAETFAPAGVRYSREAIVEPFLGVAAVPPEEGAAGGPGLEVVQVVRGSAAEEAGLREGDRLLRVGEVSADDLFWGERFRASYRDRAGERVRIVYVRAGDTRTAEVTLRTRTRYEHDLSPLDEIPEKARRIREGILK